ncbi:uncharacterized protein LOC127241113 isoform X2 [Andrographis paniculata]|uniref:uncharacterized protein LOC127241113 isoform X2 n=1 Tax=Andrographis paniculata TaxID=175694 RepID=UPI0021E705B4|nr:uncharacterized protein LOC127241113 isoform X2 [Andrographis paniculata]
MSGGLSSSSESSLDADDLLEIRERLKELTKEKEMLRDSKSHSFDLIKKLELHAKASSKSREEDKQHIEDLERQLCNCNQEIDYLQDQLNTRNFDLTCLGEQICNLQLKLAEMESQTEEMGKVKEQLKVSESERLSLKNDLADKENAIRYSTSRIRKLEDLISSMALEYQCEIEGTKLESVAVEQNLLETKKLLEESNLEKSNMRELIHNLELQVQDANMVIDGLYKENSDLKEKLRQSEVNAKAFARKVEEQFHKSMDPLDIKWSSKLKEDISIYGDALGPLFSKLSTLSTPDADLRNKAAEMSRRIDDYEVLVGKLTAELREERLKSKEEAEDLAQEMAELRYQLTSMLDEERKRRANIEQISLQRIAELEAQIASDRQKSTGPQDRILRIS